MTHAPHGAASGTARPLPERAELLPGVWRLPLPLRDSPLGHVNTYLVRTDDGYLLVDCGWDTADTLRALEGHLRALEAIEFLKQRPRASTLRSLRVALYGARLDVRQASLLRAVFIEIRKFLRRKGVLDDIGPVGARPSADLTGRNASGTLAEDL